MASSLLLNRTPVPVLLHQSRTACRTAFFTTLRAPTAKLVPRRPFILNANAKLAASTPNNSLIANSLLEEAVNEVSLNSVNFPLLLAALPVLDNISEGLETPVQLLYLLTLLGFLAVGAYLVVRQVLARQELEESAKLLGERIRSNEASAEDYFELGVVLLRKKLYTQATKNLEKAKKRWEGLPEELAQVHNALGFAYFNMEKTELAIQEYRKAVELQPGYVTAWNNLGNAYEKVKQVKEALDAYQEALSYAPNNKVAQARADSLKTRITRGVA